MCWQTPWGLSSGFFARAVPKKAWSACGRVNYTVRNRSSSLPQTEDVEDDPSSTVELEYSVKDDVLTLGGVQYTRVAAETDDRKAENE